MSNELNLPQVDSNQGVEKSIYQKKWEAPELNFKCPSKGSEYLCQYFLNALYVSVACPYITEALSALIFTTQD